MTDSAAPQPTRGPERSCFEKRSYPSEETAETAEKVANHVWCERRVSLRVYFCDRCALWHLTKQGAPVREKPGFRPPLRSRNERRAFNEKRRRRDRGRQ